MKALIFLVLLSTSHSLFAYSYPEIAIKVKGDIISEVTIGSTCYSKVIALSSKVIMKKLSSLSDGIYVCEGAFSDNDSVMNVNKVTSCRMANNEETETNCPSGH